MTDVIVVGAGIAGLTCAHALARAGKRVLVLEHNHQAGGLMAGIWRKGFHFDAGDQSFESLGMTLPLLEEMGIPRSRFRRSTYQIRMPGLDTVVTSLDQLEEAFAGAYPADRAGLRRVFDAHRRTSALCTAVSEGDCIPYVGDGGQRRARRWARLAARLLPEARMLAASVTEEFGPWYARQMAAGPLRDTLGSAGYSRMSVFVASAFWHLWANDYWYPEGGYARLWEDLVHGLRAAGGEVRFKTTVAGLRTRGDRATAVVTSRGERLDADTIVWTGDLRSAVMHLTGPERWPRRVVDAVQRAPLSDPLVSLYLGLDLPPESLRETLRASHLFWFPQHGRTQNTARPDADFHVGQFLEVTSHSLTDPSLCPPGQTGLVAQSMTRWDWDRHWGTAGDPMVRARAYEDAKRRVGDQLLAGLARLLPGIEDRVVFQDVGTPPSTMRFTRAADGASCGFMLNLLEFPFKATLARFTTPLRNVLLAGHGTIWPGSVPMAALSGRIVAQRLIEGYYTHGIGRLTARLVDTGARAAVPDGLRELPLAPKVRARKEAA
ncbi:MAG: hypothetical protein AMXMBFR64_53000 [Myxococcales bacterium]